MIENNNQNISSPAQASSDFEPAFKETGDFSPAQLQQLAQNLVDKGKVTAEQANEMLAADGVAPLQPKTQRSEFDLQPAGAPTDFRVPRLSPHGEPISSDDPGVDALMRNGLSKAGFAKSAGTSLAEDLVKATHQYSSFKNDAARESWAQSEKVKLYNAGFTQERILQSAVEMTRRSPDFMDWLQKSGAGSSSSVIMQMVLQTERLTRAGK